MCPKKCVKVGAPVLDGRGLADELEEDARKPFVKEARNHLLAADAHLAFAAEDAADAFAGAGVRRHSAGLARVHLAVGVAIAFEGAQADGRIDAPRKQADAARKVLFSTAGRWSGEHFIER